CLGLNRPHVYDAGRKTGAGAPAAMRRLPRAGKFIGGRMMVLSSPEFCGRNAVAPLYNVRDERAAPHRRRRKEYEMLKKTACALALTGLIAACANDPNNARSVGAGAALGAGVGALTGALIGGRHSTLIGAGVGAIGGAGLGAYLGDQQ